MGKYEAVRPRVHQRGNPRLDGVLDFVAFTARPMPLLTLLDEAPRRVAALLESHVCSLYLVEGDKSALVMRGNVGFTHSAVGQVRLRVGEGITGEAVEYMRPISTDSAEQHASYKHFAELGEERFPVFLAVPIRGKSGPLGALVVQRRERPFQDRDVELLTALGGLIAAGIRHAELVDEARERGARRTGAVGTRKVTLTGRPVVGGRALGAIAALRRPPARPTSKASSRDPKAETALLRNLFDLAEKAIRGLGDRAALLESAVDARFLATYAEILADSRLRERALEFTRRGETVARSLAQVARDATRTAASLTRDAFLEERAKDIEDLCDALTALADSERSTLPSKALLVGDRLTVFDVLVSARFRPAGIALSETASGPRTQVLLRLLEVPAIVDVKNIFRWASDGDVALLDGDHGFLVINPSRSEMASLREHRRAGRARRAGQVAT